MDGPPNGSTFSKITEGDGKAGVKPSAAAAAAAARTTTPKKNKLSVVIKKKKIGIKVKPKRGGPGVTATTTAHGLPARRAAAAAIGKNSNRRRLNVGLVGGGRGLPSSTKTTIRTSVDNDDDDETNKKNDTVDEFDAIYGNGSGDGDESSMQLLPNDTLLAIQSIQQDAQGLHIPCNGGNSTIPITIQAVLESQIYNRFNTNHASTVFQEIRNLFTTKQIKALPCLGIGSSNTNSTSSSGSSTNSVVGSYHHLHQHRKRIALVTTKDYISGVWMAHENFLSNNKLSPTTKGTSATTSSSPPIHQRPMTNQKYHQITTWFTTHLSKSWTQPSVISKHDLEFEWQNIIVNNNNVEITEEEATSTLSSSNNQRIIVTLDHALYYLQVQLQVLMRDGSSLSSSTAASVNDNEIYNLWLPQWGIVLKAWNEAQQQLLSQIKRSRGGIAKSIGRSNSVSAASGRRKGTTGEISEQNLLHTNRHSNISTKFLLDDLFSQGIIRRIERPFGTFIQLE